MKNTITAVLDEFFPEYTEMFKCPVSGKASRHILKTCPFPKLIIALGEDDVTAEIKKAVKKTVGRNQDHSSVPSGLKKKKGTISFTKRERFTWTKKIQNIPTSLQSKISLITRAALSVSHFHNY